MARNRDRLEPAAFADEVLALFRWAANGSVGQPPSYSRDSCKAAVGLSAIEQLVRREVGVFKQQPGGPAAVLVLAERGLLEAAEMIDALKSGGRQDHPIFDFVKGISARG
jgi:hypothetical protein